MSYLSSFIRLTWLSVGACPIFIADTERDIGVRTHRQTNANSSHVSSVTSVLCINYFRFRSIPFLSIPDFPASPAEKVTAILEAPPPKTEQELRAFLCLVNYYMKFV